MNIYSLKKSVNLDDGLFTQVPNSLLANPKINATQFRILSFLILCHWQKVDIDSKLISIHLGLKQDTVRRNLRYMSKSDEITKYFNFFFKSNRFQNLPDKIIVVHKYIPDRKQEMELNNIKVPDADIFAIRQYLTGSKYFSKNNPVELFIKAETQNKDELLLGLVYIDSKKSIRNPIAYLNRCFKQGKFIYKKEYSESLEPATAKKPKIKEKLIYEVRTDQMNYLIEKTYKDYQFTGINLSANFQIVSCTYHTKPANIKTILDKYNIEYKILKIREDQFYSMNFEDFNPKTKTEFLSEIKSFLKNPHKLKVNV